MITSSTTGDAYSKPSAESSLLHALMWEPGKAKKLIFKLDPDIFHGQFNRRVFLKVRELYAAGKIVDLVTVSDGMSGTETVEISRIYNDFGYMDSADQYIAILDEAKRRREIFTFSRAIQTMAGDHMVEVNDMVGRIRNFSATFRERKAEETVVEALYKAYEELFDTNPDRFPRTGLEALDKAVGGFEPGTLTIIGARPGVGKSIVGAQTLLFNAHKGKKSLLVNREMLKKNLGRRLISNVTGLNAGKTKPGNCDEETVKAFLDGIQSIAALPLDIINWAARPSEIRGAVIEKMEDEGLDLLVVDYLQRLEPDGRFIKRNEAVASISWALKDIAMKFKIPVVLLSQLNRDAANKRPTIANLKESGDIEQDADTIILLHEPDEIDVASRMMALYRKCQDEDLTFTEFIIGKNREGVKAVLPMIGDKAHMKFIQPTREEKP